MSLFLNITLDGLTQGLKSRGPGPVARAHVPGHEDYQFGPGRHGDDNDVHRL